MTEHIRSAYLTVAFTVACVGLPVSAADWPQWLGPTRDGNTPEVPAKLPEKKLLWKQPVVGEIHAGLAVAGGFVIVADHDEDKDYYKCLNATTGAAVWTYTAENAETMDYGSGPRATPLIQDGVVYTVSAIGGLCALDLAKGTVLWKQDFAKEYEGGTPQWGYCCSPLCADGKLIFSPCGKSGIVAVDPKTGKALWKTAGGGNAYSSYIVGTFGEVKQVVGYDGDQLAGWDLADGKRLWGVAPENAGDYCVGTPINVAGKLMLASENNGARLYAFDKGGKIQEKPVAVNEEVVPDMGSPIFLKDSIYVSSPCFFCLDAETLKARWKNEEDANLQGFTCLAAGPASVLVLDGAGNLTLLAANPEKCEVLGRMNVCGKTLAYPAVADGKLYVRDEKFVYCYSMK